MRRGRHRPKAAEALGSQARFGSGTGCPCYGCPRPVGRRNSVSRRRPERHGFGDDGGGGGRAKTTVVAEDAGAAAAPRRPACRGDADWWPRAARRPPAGGRASVGRCRRRGADPFTTVCMQRPSTLTASGAARRRPRILSLPLLGRGRAFTGKEGASTSSASRDGLRQMPGEAAVAVLRRCCCGRRDRPERAASTRRQRLGPATCSRDARRLEDLVESV